MFQKHRETHDLLSFHHFHLTPWSAPLVYTMCLQFTRIYNIHDLQNLCLFTCLWRKSMTSSKVKSTTRLDRNCDLQSFIFQRIIYQQAALVRRLVQTVTCSVEPPHIPDFCHHLKALKQTCCSKTRKNTSSQSFPASATTCESQSYFNT